VREEHSRYVAVLRRGLGFTKSNGRRWKQWRSGARHAALAAIEPAGRRSMRVVRLRLGDRRLLPMWASRSLSHSDVDVVGEKDVVKMCDKSSSLGLSHARGDTRHQARHRGHSRTADEQPARRLRVAKYKYRRSTCKYDRK